jgi:hypothetical protein
MNQATIRGGGRHSLTVDILLDKDAKFDLAPDWKPPKRLTLPMSAMLQFVGGQVYRKECGGLRFQVTISIVLVDRYAGRQDSKIKDDNSIELVYHDNGSQ